MPSLWVELFQKGRRGRSRKRKESNRNRSRVQDVHSAPGLENVVTKHDLGVGAGGEVER